MSPTAALIEHRAMIVGLVVQLREGTDTPINEVLGQAERIRHYIDTGEHAPTS